MRLGMHCFSCGACEVDGAGGNIWSRRQGWGGEAQGPPCTPAPQWDYQVKEELGSPKLIHRPNDEGEPGVAQGSRCRKGRDAKLSKSPLEARPWGEGVSVGFLDGKSC